MTPLHCDTGRNLDGRAVCTERAHLPVSHSTVAGRLAPSNADGPLVTGRYLVIGSFTNRRNADTWARFNDEFGTDVVKINDRRETTYRVVVGPLQPEDVAMMREILNAADVGETWFMSLGGMQAARTRSRPELANAGAVTQMWPNQAY